MTAQTVDYLIVLSLGALVGLIEILSRYRDAPFRVAMSPAALSYVALNAGFAGLALMLLRLFDLHLTENPNPEVVRAVQVMAAGFGAMILFRSSIFVFRLGDQDVFIGPSTVLQVMLSAVDREVDRKRAEQRATAVTKAMDGVSFNEAITTLPTICIAVMQNLPREDQDEILTRVEALAHMEKMPEKAKNLALALTLINVVGEEVLLAAIGALKLKPAAGQKKQSLPEPALASGDGKRKQVDLLETILAERAVKKEGEGLRSDDLLKKKADGGAEIQPDDRAKKDLERILQERLAAEMQESPATDRPGEEIQDKNQPTRLDPDALSGGTDVALEG